MMHPIQMLTRWLIEASSQPPTTAVTDGCRTVLSIYFEKGFATETTASAPSSSPPSKRKKSVSTSSVNTCSPAYAFLKHIHKKQAHEARATPSSSSSTAVSSSIRRPCFGIQSVEQFCWDANTISHIFAWLYQHKVRYTYSDWERSRESIDGRWHKSQHGQFHGHSTTRLKHYVCHQPSTTPHAKTLCMPVIIETRKSHKTGFDHKWEEGILQQHRIYKYNSCVSIHICTRCSKWYRIWVDIEPANFREKKNNSLHILLTEMTRILNKATNTNYQPYRTKNGTKPTTTTAM
jgi:hypothetical protein